jgi:hypothetical protein
MENVVRRGPDRLKAGRLPLPWLFFRGAPSVTTLVLVA